MTAKFRQRARQNIKQRRKEQTAVIWEGRLGAAAQTAVTTTPLWTPNPDRDDGTPNPQRLAYESPADILGYGGAGGGGKTDLLLGLAATQHNQSIIFRRIFKNLRGIIKRSREILSQDGRPKDGFNESLHRWKLDDGRTLELESMQYEKDKENFRGFPHDFYGFDEATEFSRSQIEFVLGWMRSTKAGQRCRAVLTFNPPIDSGGSWVIDYFLPWLAFLFPDKFTHPNPATPGELRWYTTIDGKETECKDGTPFEIDGELYQPLSRTFIPAKLNDNPHLFNTNYRAVLQSMPEPLRSQMLYGDFTAGGEDDPNQVIPTRWVQLAQQRWLEMERPSMPLSGVGVDIARGGVDKLVISKRYGTWFDELTAVPGVKVEDGPAAAGMVYNACQSDKHIGYINVDIIGIGTSPYDSLKAMYSNGLVNAVNASHGSSYAVKSESGQVVIKMKNVRAEYHWRLREALDPETGEGLALPPDNELVADLCAARYKWLAGGIIQIEEKDDIKKRIGRSPDRGEAVMLAWHKTTPPASLGTPQTDGRSKWGDIAENKWERY